MKIVLAIIFIFVSMHAEDSNTTVHQAKIKYDGVQKLSCRTSLDSNNASFFDVVLKQREYVVFYGNTWKYSHRKRLTSKTGHITEIGIYEDDGYVLTISHKDYINRIADEKNESYEIGILKVFKSVDDIDNLDKTLMALICSREY